MMLKLRLETVDLNLTAVNLNFIMLKSCIGIACCIYISSVLHL